MKYVCPCGVELYDPDNTVDLYEGFNGVMYDPVVINDRGAWRQVRARFTGGSGLITNDEWYHRHECEACKHVVWKACEEVDQ